jgi:hypothetical protein
MNQNQSSNESYNSLQSQSISNYELNKFNNQNQILKPMAIPQGQIQPVPIVINQMAQQNAIYIDTTKIKTKPFGLNCPVCNAHYYATIDDGGPTPFLYVAKYGEQPASLLDSEGQKRSEKIPLLYQELSPS